jgi:hypothetical protein
MVLERIKKIVFIIMVFSLVLTFNVYCDIWRTYLNPNHADNIFANGDDVWVIVDGGGLVLWNMADGSYTRFYEGSGISSNLINGFAHDEQNRLLIYTYNDKSISRYENGAFNVIAQVPNDHTDFGYADGSILLSGNNIKGVSKYNGTTWEEIPELSGYSVFSFTQDPRGGFWCVTTDKDHKLIYYKDGLQTIFTRAEVTDSDDPRSLFVLVDVESSGVIWAYHGGGVSWYSDDKWNHYYWDKKNMANRSRNSVRDTEGNVWVAGSYDGLFKYDRIKWTNVPEYSSENVLWVANAAEGGIWVGLETSLELFDGSKRTPYVIKNMLPISNYLRAITINSNGDLWCGDAKGDLAFLHQNNWKPFRGRQISHSEWGETGELRCLLATENSDIWVGFTDEIFRYDGSNWTSYRDNLNSEIGCFIADMIETPDHDIFAAASFDSGTESRYGVGLWHDGNWEFSHPFGVSQLYSHFTKDTDGKIWYETTSEIDVFNSTEWQKVANCHDFPIQDFQAYTITAVSDGTIWIGGYRGIVVLRDNEVIKSFTKDDGLPYDPYSPPAQVTAIKEALDKSIWIMTDYGLVNYDGSNFKVYDSKYSSSDSNFCIDSGGRLFLTRGGFAGSGLTEFTPTSVTLKMSLFADQIAYKAGDKLNISLMVNNYGPDETGDLYFVMLAPDGNFYSGLDWSQGLHPAASNLTIPANFSLPVTKLLNLTLPSTTPPISQVGKYYFAIALADTGTTYLRSKAIVTIDVQ